MRDQLESLVLHMYRTGITYSEAVDEFQKLFLLTVLREHKGNQVKAAQELRVHRNTLRRTALTLGLDIRTVRERSKRKPLASEMALPLRKKSSAA